MKIKKLITASALMLSLATAGYAQISQPDEAGIYTPNGNVFIEGKLDASEITQPYVTILLSNDENIAFIRQVNLEKDGSYALKFKNLKDIDGYTLSVREGNRDLNSSVNVSKIETCLPVVDITLENDKNDWYFPTGSELEAQLDIEAKYADSDYTFDIIAAFYTEDDKLIGGSTVTTGISGDYKEQKNQKIENVPQSCAKVKAFVWTSISEAIPLSGADTAEFDKYIFGTEQEEMTIALIGDSITHNPDSYKSMFELFYMTRYPDKKLTFVNKGIGGNTTGSVLARFDWDVMDCEGKKPDAAIVLIGGNDIGKPYYADVSKAGDREWNYNKFTKDYPVLINKLLENDIEVVLISTSLYDEGDDPALTGTLYACDEVGANRTGLARLAEFIKGFAADNKLPYIPLNETQTAITTKLRASNPGIGTIFTISDRTHPTPDGAMFTACLLAEMQTKKPTIATVDIDAATGNVKTENATVSEVTATKDGVEYTYLSKALPLPVNDSYNKIINTFGYNITEKLNNEIIKVSGLADGEYTVTFDGEYVLGTYSAEELSNGINIAVSLNNPAQTAVNEAFELIKKKDKDQYSLGQLARHKSTLLSNNVDLNDDTAVKACLGTTNYNEYKSGLESADEKLNRIQSYREQARALCTPKTHIVTITK